jgi:hypothetical protein
MIYYKGVTNEQNVKKEKHKPKPKKNTKTCVLSLVPTYHKVLHVLSPGTILRK